MAVFRFLLLSLGHHDLHAWRRGAPLGALLIITLWTSAVQAQTPTPTPPQPSQQTPLLAMQAALRPHHEPSREPADRFKSSPAHSASDCLAPAHSRLLDPGPAITLAELGAQAAWLDARTLRVSSALAGSGAAQWLLLRGKGLLAGLKPMTVLNPALERLALQALDAASQSALKDRPSWAVTSAMGEGPVLQLGTDPGDALTLEALHREPHVLAGLDAQGRVVVLTRLQSALALDALFAPSAEPQPLGVEVSRVATRWSLWAPTSRRVSVCIHGPSEELDVRAAVLDPASGIWRAEVQADLRGRTYTYLVEVLVPQEGWVLNRVTDPYSISLTADSRRSYVGSLEDPALMPAGWRGHRRPAAPRASVDMMISELHVRDFSASDESVPASHQGRYMAFTHSRSRGMKHLTEQARAGLTDIHLLPIFDLATVPEVGCKVPDVGRLRSWAPDSDQQQALVQATVAQDCFNWGYDPLHFNAPEGSYATDPRDPAVRIREMRAMIMALHRIGLRVGMDVVYNHMSASGQHPHSVLDRIVPGYYHRLDANGRVERSTCCDNTATEHRMMRKLMIDSAVLWVRHHAIDSFRFDLMGHQPREAMQALQQAVDRAAGRRIPLIGEGWNFGEVADGARFVQASQLSLGGSGIGTFNDRLRDAARGTRHGDDVATTVSRKGWLNGWSAAKPDGAQRAHLAEQADLIRAGLAGSLKDFRFTAHDGRVVDLQDVPYSGQGAGYVTEPGEAVNYVENHDNPTLFDLLAFKLPLSVGALERAQIQVLGSALVALAQGVAYWHAGQEILRSKSMDLNSYDSGDWFNRLDWGYTDNGFAAGLPPGQDSRAFWPVIGPRLAHPGIKPSAAVIDFSRRAHLDLLRLRATTPLLRLPTAQAIKQRLTFPRASARDTPQSDGHPDPGLILVHIDGRGWPGSPHRAVLLAFNAAPYSQQAVLPELVGQRFTLHPVHRSPRAADPRMARESTWTPRTGTLSVPPRSAVVYVRRSPG